LCCMFAHTVCLRDARAAEGVGPYKGVGIENIRTRSTVFAVNFGNDSRVASVPASRSRL
jgi:hypothetical protein